MTKPSLFNILITILVTALILLSMFFSIKYLFFSSSENRKNEIAENTNYSDATIKNLATNKSDSTQYNKVEKNIAMQKQADSLLNLFDNMSSVPVFVKDEPILRNGTNTERGLGYTTCENKNVPTIYIKKVFFQKNNQKQIINILKHELTHAYFCRQGFQVGHDERWRKKFESVGGFGN